MVHGASARTVQAFIAIGVVSALLVSARPATAEDATPTPSPTSSATGDAATTDQARPLGSRSQAITLEYLPDIPVGKRAKVVAEATSGLQVELLAEGSCRLSTVNGKPVAIATDAGECTVVASQAGDDVYAAAPDESQTFEFYPAETDVSAGIPGDDVVEIGKTMTVRITVTGEEGGDPRPSGTVSLKVDGPSVSGAGLDAIEAMLGTDGSVSIVVPESLTSALAKGPHTVYASYVGDNGYQAARTSAEFDVLAPGAGYVVPPAGSPVARFIRDYQPIRGFSYEPRPSNRWNDKGAKWVTEDSDYYNADFSQLWGPAEPGRKGRDDLGTMAGIGVNMLHIYNWNPGRLDHDSFLDYARDKGMGVTIPISNYTHCLIAENCDEVKRGTGGYRAAYENIKRIFNQVYLPGNDRKPHRAAAIWDVFNEFDGSGISTEEVVFVISSILKLEQDLNVPESGRLPFFVPTTTGGALGAVNGIGATRAVRDALRASAEGSAKVPQAWVDLNLPSIPKDFWQTRFVASTNPFQDAPQLATILLETWPNAFKGGDEWSDLPPMFFGEMGIENLPKGPSQPPSGEYEKNGHRIREQLACTNPLASNGGTPGGYFLGATMFEFSQEMGKVDDPSSFDWWGVQTMAGPDKFWKGVVLPTAYHYGDYRIDELQTQPGWFAIRDGFRDTTSECPGR